MRIFIPGTHLNKRANNRNEISRCIVKFMLVAALAYGAKYPLMSISRSVASLENTSIDLLLPAGTMAALATTPPFGAFNVEAFGNVIPVGNAVKYTRSPPEGTTAVRFKE